MSRKRKVNACVTTKAIKSSTMQSSLEETNHASAYVLMPWDDKSQIIVSKSGCEISCSRWEFILEQLHNSVPITNCNDLINVIKSYNPTHDNNGKPSTPSWKFLVLQKYFSNLDSNEIKEFFKNGGLLSTIRNLVLQLPNLVSRLEILEACTNSTVTLHQMQVASLLANGFFCTFPKPKADCPIFNFNMLYDCTVSSAINSNVEKIKCIIHYFYRIQKKKPTGTISFHRLCIPDHKFPRWDKTSAELCSLTVDSKGKIEDQQGFLQMDFANKYVGGGVLGRGCVQEEIRFIICPELIVSRLFTECLADNEALLIIGAERYCQYSGYASTFKFNGNYQDLTPSNENGQKNSFLIVIDALYFNRYSEQFRESKILRELKKAYVGFKPLEGSEPLPLATGNWGCGAFGGDPQLKSLLQLMASSQAQRNMLYLTFGDDTLKKQIEDLYRLLKENSVNVGMLYRIIRLYHKEKRKNQSVFEFVKEAVVDKNEKKTSAIRMGNLLSSKKNNLTYSSSSSSSPPSTITTTSSPSQSSSSSSSISFLFGHQVKSLQSNVDDKTNNSSRKIFLNCDEDNTNFPDLQMDFEMLDKDVEKQLSNQLNYPKSSAFVPTKECCSTLYEEGASKDIVWFENEMIAKRNKDHIEKNENMVVSPSLFSEDEEAKKSQERVFDFSVGENLKIFNSSRLSVTEDKPIKDDGMPNLKQEELSLRGKKLVQKKITECFSKKS